MGWRRDRAIAVGYDDYDTEPTELPKAAINQLPYIKITPNIKRRLPFEPARAHERGRHT